LVNPEYTGTLTGGTGVVNIGSGQVYKDASGNVGIGTTSPSAPLEVNGTATAVRATSAQLWLSRTTASTHYEGICFRSGLAQDAFIGRPPNSDDITFGFDAGSVLAEAMRLDSSGNLKFNSGYGSVATAYGCRAWVNFNGTGTVAIRASGNVSSITDTGVGQYTVNFANAMVDANYAGVTGFQRVATSDFTQVGFSRTTSTDKLEFWSGGAFTDTVTLQVAYFR